MVSSSSTSSSSSSSSVSFTVLNLSSTTIVVVYTLSVVVTAVVTAIITINAVGDRKQEQQHDSLLSSDVNNDPKSQNNNNTTIDDTTKSKCRRRNGTYDNSKITKKNNINDVDVKCNDLDTETDTNNEVATSNINDCNDNGSNMNNNNTIANVSTIPTIPIYTMYPIGIIKSIYQLCIGTPRQGLLVCNSRGCIELIYLSSNAANDCIYQLQQFSHIWILFYFHLNNNITTNTVTTTTNKSKTTNKNNYQYVNDIIKTPAKISPPSLGGTTKIGVLATRSPHRYNPIGMSLVKLDNIRTIKRRQQQRTDTDTDTTTNSKSKSKLNSKLITVVCLDISGLDLVDGTPVLDIKPYVPTYDAPPPTTKTTVQSFNNCRVPEWVSDGLQTKRTVLISNDAKEQLQNIIQTNPYSLQFYNPDNIYNITNVNDSNSNSNDNNKRNNSNDNYNNHDKQQQQQIIHDIVTYVLQCIEQILAIDVRSTYQTKKVRDGKFRVEQSERYQQQQLLSSATTSTSLQENEQDKETSTIYCTQQIDNLLVQYTIDIDDDDVNDSQVQQQQRRLESIGSGAEDIVTVRSIKLIATI